MVNSGFQDSKTNCNACKKGKAQRDHNLPDHRDWPHIGQRLGTRLGEKREKDKWFNFHAATGGGVQLAGVPDLDLSLVWETPCLPSLKNQGALKGRNSKGKTEQSCRSLLIFSGFLLLLDSLWKSTGLGAADFRREPHELCEEKISLTRKAV